MAASSCFPVVLTIFLHGGFLVGTVKAMGVFLGEMFVSLRMTSTDIGLVLGLFYASGYIPSNVFPPFYIEELFDLFDLFDKHK